MNQKMRDISEGVDNPFPQERSRRKHMNKKTLVGLGAVLIACTLIASGAILTQYGVINVTANVEQSVVTSSDKTNWHDYSVPITCVIDEMSHSTDYCYKDWIWNRASKDAMVEFSIDHKNAPKWTDGKPDFDGYHISHFLFGETQTIRLVQKVVDFGNSPWDELVDGMEASLTFDTCNERFSWSIESDIPNLTDYSLIYYANYPDYWDAAPVFVIGGLSGVADIPSMPYPDDQNALRPILDEGETYTHQYGAKFWLVPIEAISEGNVLDWSMAEYFLFETDLGFYNDCDETEPVSIPEVWNIFNLIDDDTATLRAGTMYCWITCNRVDMGIMGGAYVYDQVLSPPVLQ